MNDTAVSQRKQARTKKNLAKVRDSADAQKWLLMFHQLPPEPAYFRVKVWRRLQALGALAIKNSVYVLPVNDQAREDFQWLLREIVQGGGEGSVCEAQFIDGLSDAQVRDMFKAARKVDYDALLKELRTLAGGSSATSRSSPDAGADLQAQVSRLRKRLADISSLDFFKATGREPVERLLDSIERRVHAAASHPSPERGDKEPLGELSKRTWVTRRGVQVDRMASAWLIRRFIDPAATFRFVDAKAYKPVAGELRFDMFEAEFTHEGDLCTFEVLIERAGLANDPGLEPIAQIVHDIDLKDNKYGREEAMGIALLLNGIVAVNPGDEHRLARAGAMFDDLYEFFQKSQPAQQPKKKKRR